MPLDLSISECYLQFVNIILAAVTSRQTERLSKFAERLLQLSRKTCDQFSQGAEVYGKAQPENYAGIDFGLSLTDQTFFMHF